MRNTICAALTAITLVLCAAPRRMRQCVQDVYPGPRHRRHRHHMLQKVRRRHQGMHRHTVDTRQVVCVVYSGYQRGGLSCDWSHVSGADKEPAR